MKTAIQLQPCDSSRICAFGYDPARNVLALQFKAAGGNGPVYEYQNVTPEIYSQWTEADSKGRFFGKILGDKEKFPYTKMVDEEEKARVS